MIAATRISRVSQYGRPIDVLRNSDVTWVEVSTQQPAAGLDGNDRGQEFLRCHRAAGSESRRWHPTCRPGRGAAGSRDGRAHRVRPTPRRAEAVAPRLPRKKRPASRSVVGWNMSFSTVPVAAVPGQRIVERQRRCRVGFLQHRPESIGDQATAILDGTRHQRARLPVRTLELEVEHYRQRYENADQRHQLERQRRGQPTQPRLPAQRRGARLCPSDSQRTDNFRFRRSPDRSRRNFLRIRLMQERMFVR